MNPVFLSLALLLLFPFSPRTQEAGRVTLVEGALRVIRGTTVLQAKEGMSVRQGDILESSDTGFAQVELAGGPIVALGPASRIFLFSQHAGAELVLLSGWLKGESSPSSGACRYASPLLAATSQGGSIVLHAAAATEIFVEYGSAAIAVVNPDGRLGQTTQAKGGFFSRRPGKAVTTAPRPDAAFVSALPRAFRDTLPSRLTHFAGKPPIEPKRDHEVSYPEVQPWLTMAHAWRRGFLERFQPRLSDPEFRKGVEVHLNEHPEWDRILHPEKYQPKAPPPAATPGSQ